jgi:RecA-family ATPase
MVETLAFVTGRDLLFDRLATSGRAWYLGLVDPLEEYERRVAAILLHYKIPPSEVVGGLFLDSGRNQDFVIARSSRGGTIIAQPVVDSILVEITKHQIPLLTVDPFVACHAVNENDNMAIEQVTRQWRDIADKERVTQRPPAGPVSGSGSTERRSRRSPTATSTRPR